MSRAVKATESTHCYAGRSKCGCWTAVVIDEPDYPKDTAKSVAEFIREGLSVTRMTIEEFQATTFGHTCGKTPAAVVCSAAGLGAGEAAAAKGTR